MNLSKEKQTYKNYLWNGEKEKVINELKWENNFRKYLEKYRERLINYYQHQTKELSSVKQIKYCGCKVEQMRNIS